MNDKSSDDGNIIVRTLIRGALGLLPLVIVGLLFYLVFDFLFGILQPISEFLDPGSDNPHWLVHVLSALILFFIILGLGTILRTRTGKKVLEKIEMHILQRIPLYAQISDIVYQFAGVKDMPFKQVALIDPFGTGAKMTGFIAEKNEQDYYTVFVPTAPNPTNGNIFHLPKDQVTLIDLPPQTAMQTVVGMGTGSEKLFLEAEQEASEKGKK